MTEKEKAETTTFEDYQKAVAEVDVSELRKYTPARSNGWEDKVARIANSEGLGAAANGWPDLLITDPRDGGIVCVVECKRGEDKLSLEQSWMHQVFRRAGVPVIVARPEHEEDIRDAIRKLKAAPQLDDASVQIAAAVSSFAETTARAFVQAAHLRDTLSRLKMAFALIDKTFDVEASVQHGVNEALRGHKNGCDMWHGHGEIMGIVKTLVGVETRRFPA